MKNILILILTIIFTSGCSKDKQTKHPNIIYVFPDQFRKTAVGFWNTPEFNDAISTQADPVYTPNLNAFAKSAIVFTSATAPTPICSPSRSSLMTGMFPTTSGVPLNCNSLRPISSLRKDVVCFSDVLNNNGYDLAYFGKWHLDHPTKNNPQNPGSYLNSENPCWDAYTPPESRHGFNHWYSYGTFDVHKNPHYFDNDGTRHEPKEYSPKHEANKVIEYLQNKNAERDNNKPFAIFVAMNPPHSPYNSLEDCMEEDFNLYKNYSLSELLVRDNADTSISKAHSASFYFANITGVDREFGRILNELDKLNLSEHTIVVFSSDHGETMCSHGVADAKNTIYNEAFEIPLLIRWKGKIQSEINNMLISVPDIMPSLLGLLGLSADIPQTVEGTDYSNHFLKIEDTTKMPKSTLYIRNIDGAKDKNGKVLNYFPVARGVKTERYSLELTIDHSGELTNTKFFDNKTDPYQMNNLIVDKSNPVITELLNELKYWLKKSKDPWHNDKILSDWIDY
ncbi:MAG: sulfatase [Bacteroidales bacterium]